ncbi:hypothetical protein [Luteimonas sp. MC1895]|uniref:hypothetical protein n=1 Tax=Luteimonas sp. MC1895 TaxID=2819513 RepID=UPI0018F07155|nr:hypothetical protein [Luteimonas sp. MC1895]MBJ6979449.1 hypothetical protein [Luteimonas sp. MC1895]
MEGKFTVFEYVYRDAGNFKTSGRLLLSGQDTNAEAAIRGCLEWSDQFVAEQIGVPALCNEHWESVGEDLSDLDHAFHEFVGLRDATKEDLTLTVWGSLELVVGRMQIAAGKWDVTLSPNCDL